MTRNGNVVIYTQREEALILARFPGIITLPDPMRGEGWKRYRKGCVDAWATHEGWTCADLVGQTFIRHRTYLDLKDALEDLHNGGKFGEEQGNLFDQPQNEPRESPEARSSDGSGVLLGSGTQAVLNAAQRDRMRQLERRRKRLGPPVGDGETLQQRFERFHSENPDVYDALVKLARKVKASGLNHYGIAGLYEVLRYDSAISTNGKPFKLSDNYKSRYSRLIMSQEPDLEGFFSTKELTAL